MIRTAQPDDAAQICDIYNHYVLNTPITFEEEGVVVDDMRQRVLDITGELPWLVCEKGSVIEGYCYASKWKGRCAYRYSVESTVYVRFSEIGRGVGSSLYDELLQRLRQTGFHTVIGGIALPNEPSISFHEKFGFVKVAHFEHVGRKFDKWIDVGYWQLLFD